MQHILLYHSARKSAQLARKTGAEMKSKCSGSGSFSKITTKFSFETASGKREDTVTCPTCKRTFKARGNNVPPHKKENA
jgi:hypothetical protein